MNDWIKILDENKKGRDFIVGDLHGCLNELIALLATVQFNPKRDRLISVGDLVDRGHYSKECLDLLRKPWFYAVRGNHEQMVIEHWDNPEENQAYDKTWLDNLSEDDFQIYKSLIESLPHVIHVKNKNNPYFVLHAEIWEHGVLLTDEIILNALFKDMNQLKAKSLWSRHVIKSHWQDSGSKFHHNSLSRIFCGHSIVQVPLMVERAIYIDTGAFAPYSDPINGAAEHFGLSLVEAKTLNYWFAPTNPAYRGTVVNMGLISAQLGSDFSGQGFRLDADDLDMQDSLHFEA